MCSTCIASGSSEATPNDTAAACEAFASRANPALWGLRFRPGVCGSGLTTRLPRRVATRKCPVVELPRRRRGNSERHVRSSILSRLRGVCVQRELRCCGGCGLGITVEVLGTRVYMYQVLLKFGCIGVWIYWVSDIWDLEILGFRYVGVWLF